MKIKTLVGVGVLGVVGLLLVGFAWDRRLQESLPPKEVFASQDEAFVAAFRDNNNISHPIARIAGTGSMAPYIRKSEPVTDPVAFAIFEPDGSFDTIKNGQLGAYRADYEVAIPGAVVIHILAKRTSDGLIFTGLANKTFETTTPVKREQFVGVVKKIYTWNE